MAWGQRESKGVEDVVQRLRVNEAKLTSLHIFPIRKFGHEVCVLTRSCACMVPVASCEHMKI